MKLFVKRVSPYAILPRYATSGAAGMDLSACLEEPVELPPGARSLIPTGIAAAIPTGHVGLLFARSGLAARHGLSLVNGVGVIDSDYRGEILVAMVNLGSEPCLVSHGERVAQLAVLPVVQPQILEVDVLDDTLRDTGGFGSTGLK